MLNFELITTNLRILKNRPLKIRKTYKRKRFSVFFEAKGLGFFVIQIPAFRHAWRFLQSGLENIP